MKSIYEVSKKLVEILIQEDLKITSMESCTGGFFLSCITDIENSSKVTEGGFVTYSNEAKIKQGVSKSKIDLYGVYSKETAIEMAKECKKDGKDIDKLIGVGITGSLTTVDESNYDSEMGQVYYSINYEDGKTIANSFTIDTSLSRHEMKEIIVKMIMQDIIMSLTNIEERK